MGTGGQTPHALEVALQAVVTQLGRLGMLEAGSSCASNCSLDCQRSRSPKDAVGVCLSMTRQHGHMPAWAFGTPHRGMERHRSVIGALCVRVLNPHSLGLRRPLPDVGPNHLLAPLRQVEYPFHTTDSEAVDIALLSRARVFCDGEWKYITPHHTWPPGSVRGLSASSGRVCVADMRAGFPASGPQVVAASATGLVC